MNLVEALRLFLIALAAAFGALWLLRLTPRRYASAPKSSLTEAAGPVFLFDGDHLVDCSAEARGILSASTFPGGPKARLMAYLALHFDGLGPLLDRLPELGRIDLAPRDPYGEPILLKVELQGGLTRFTLVDAEGPLALRADPFARIGLVEEVDRLRHTLSCAPLPIWRTGSEGKIVWANALYQQLAAGTLPPGNELTWPLPAIFDPGADQPGMIYRRSLRYDDVTHWFEIFTVDNGTEHLFYAVPVDGAVHAENALQEFVQTLTKTFAHLPIGLAVFDSRRHLKLFNPALVDLTGLAPEFLLTRPSFTAVLDAMRDRNMLPEPEDYRSWRRQISDMEKAVRDGQFEETWSLPGGQTYRVTGRPHPNGALALMLEDMSTEMMRTRRHQADLELGQAVIDAMDDAVAVFAPSGHLVMSNAAYAALWQHDPSGQLMNVGITELARTWRRLTALDPAWARLEDFVVALGERRAWSMESRLTDGRALCCRVIPLNGGTTLATFRAETGQVTGCPPVDPAQGSVTGTRRSA